MTVATTTLRRRSPDAEHRPRWSFNLTLAGWCALVAWTIAMLVGMPVAIMWAILLMTALR